MSENKEQNYRNHRRWVPIYHFILSTMILFLLCGAVVNFIVSIGDHERLYSSSLILLIAVALIIIALNMRTFAIKAQDRAIRAEETLRYYALSGKLFPKELKMNQIIALRFAPDEEYLALVDKSIKENLSNAAIKKEIKQWRADHHRA